MVELQLTLVGWAIQRRSGRPGTCRSQVPVHSYLDTGKREGTDSRQVRLFIARHILQHRIAPRLSIIYTAPLFGSAYAVCEEASICRRGARGRHMDLSSIAQRKRQRLRQLLLVDLSHFHFATAGPAQYDSRSLSASSR